MNVSVRELFREVADIPVQERERILAERRIASDLRAELESLLSYDSTPGDSLTRRVSNAAEEALCWAGGPRSGHCGPYRLVRLLGSGGMGAVYLAERHDGEIEQQVAVKLLRGDTDRPGWRDRFLRERQLLAYLNHASIARLLDAGHTPDGYPYLVMEYVDGVAIDVYAARLDLCAKLRLFLLVCDGVSHAHRHLIVHRDLKPSNILVDSSGQPKLLDFGIAKLQDVTPEETQTVERLLTPNYASPEQLRGDAQTTATDVYSLGAVLYKLLTGRSPREAVPGAKPARRAQADPEGIPPPSRLNPKLPRDIDCILRNALRQEPSERYASVDAFADDIRAFLEARPVQARSADAWYRTGKLLRRHRIAVAAAVITLASIWVGANAARRQRATAQTYSAEVRQLIQRFLALDEIVDGLHGSTSSMREVISVSKEYLEKFAAHAPADQGLALDVVEAYWHLARAQGICMSAGPERRAEAGESLRKANHLLEPVLRSQPGNRKALLTAANIAHDRTVIAENDRRKPEAVGQADLTVGYLARLLQLGRLSPAEARTVSELYYELALLYKNLHLPGDGIRCAKLSIETAPASPSPYLRLSMAYSMLADLLRRTGDLYGALEAIRKARANLEKAEFPNDTERRSSWARVLGREGKVLGAGGGISLNRPEEAIPPLQKAFDLIEEWAQNDGGDAWSRLLFVTAGRELGDTLVSRDPRRALAVYDHALRRVREVQDNPEGRRGEAELLAASTYPLRRLSRVSEAGQRLDTAFHLLAETRDYPADRVVLQEAADETLRALGDHLAETGEAQRASEVYENLLRKLMAANPDPRNDLSDAAALSPVYASLAALYRRTNLKKHAAAVCALRLELWRHWNTKLPGNGYVRRQLELAGNQ